MEDFKMGDVIYIKGFKEDKPEFFCWKHLKDLIGLPTKIFLIRNGVIYVTHPVLDVVPFNPECVNYEVMENIDLGYHRELKQDQQTLMSLLGDVLKDEKNKKMATDFLRKDDLTESEEKQFTKIQRNLLSLIEDFEDGDTEIVDGAFGGISNFLKLIETEGLITHINPRNVVWDDYENHLNYIFYQNDTSYIWKIVDTLSDVTKIGDEYYFDTSGEELSKFFSKGRNDVSQETIEEIIEGNYDVGYWDKTNDEYNDVYKELTMENQKLVDDKIREELTKKGALDINSKLLEKIGLEQGRGYVTLDDNIITRILEDDETMKYVINRELDDVTRDLYSLYSGCYDSELIDNWYDSIMSELVGEIIDNTTFEEYSYKKNVYTSIGKHETRTMYARRYPATKCIYNLVKEWVIEKKESTWDDDTIKYFGSYYNLMIQAMKEGMVDELRVSLDDYADYRKVNKCVNENIGDYF